MAPHATKLSGCSQCAIWNPWKTNMQYGTPTTKVKKPFKIQYGTICNRTSWLLAIRNPWKTNMQFGTPMTNVNNPCKSNLAPYANKGNSMRLKHKVDGPHLERLLCTFLQCCQSLEFLNNISAAHISNPSNRKLNDRLFHCFYWLENCSTIPAERNPF